MGWFSGKRNGVAVIGHPGDSSNFHGDMMLVPEGRYGIVLLMNSNNRIAGERMRGIVDGVTSLLLGQQPPPVEPSNGTVDIILRGILVLAVVQLLAMIWSAYTLRRLVRGAPGAVRGWLSIVRYVVAPLLFYLLLALVFLVGLRTFIIPYPWPLLLLSFPDFGTVALVCGVAALGWAIIRTAVLVRLLRHRTPRVVAPPAAPATHVQAT